MNATTRILFLGILLLSLAQQGRAQVLTGVVVDQNNKVLSNAHVVDIVQNTQVVSNSVGKFTLPVKAGSIVKVSYVGYSSQYINITDQKDTINVTVRLKIGAKDLREVTVTIGRMKKVVDQNSVNILDYVPYDHFVLALKSYKSKKILSFEGTDTTIKSFDLESINAKSFYEDCFGNIHILSKDSSYQIYVDSVLHIVSVSSLSDFEDILKPCVGAFEENSVFQSFSNHNKKYTLTAVAKEGGERKYFYSTWDKEAEQVARGDYWAIIRRYNAYAPPEGNVITNGVWNGNLIALQLPGDKELNRMISWYLKIRGRELEISSYKANKQIITFDFLSDSIYAFKGNGDMVHRTKFHVPDDKVNRTILIDKATNDFYTLNQNNGLYSISSINLINGELKEVFTLNEQTFAKNVQLYGGWVYFLKNKNGFHKLYRIKLDGVEN